MSEDGASNQSDKLKKLRALLSEGEASGNPAPFDMKSFLRKKKAAYQNRKPEKDEDLV